MGPTSTDALGRSPVLLNCRPDENPATAVIFHRMGVVVAEVTDAVNKKADKRMRWAAAIAQDLHRLAGSIQEIMSAVPPVSGMRGPSAARELKLTRRLIVSSDRFASTFDWFVKEHPGQLAEEPETRIRSFLAWLPTRQNELDSRVQEFEASMSSDLREDAGRLQELARDWSAIDPDGID